MSLRTKMTSIVLALLTAITLVAAAQSGPAGVALEAAKKKEIVDGDFDSAIQQYKAIVTKYPKERTIVTDALIHMAECYQKLGDAESRKIFEQIVRQYGDQPAAAKARAYLGGGDRASGTATVLRKIWSGSEVSAEGSVSPDGRYISYPAWDTGDLAIHDTVTGTNRLLTNNNYANKEYAQNSSFSRDGKQLAYGWYNGKDRYELRLSSLQSVGSAQPRILFDSPDVGYVVPYGWSPDGKWIATQFWRNGDRNSGPNTTTSQIGVVSVADGFARILKTLDWHGSSSLFLSPDGKYLAFDQTVSDTDLSARDVFVIAIDGTGQPQPAMRGAIAVMGWSPDGMWLLFSSDRTGSVGLWGLPFANGKVQGPPELLKSDIGQSFSLGETASGTLYVSKSINSRDSVIAPIDLDAGRLLGPPVSLTQGFVNGARMGVSSWSPDGNYLAYSAPCHGRQCIAIRSVATGKFNLLAGIVSVNGPHWSPDGRLLLTRGVDEKQRTGWFQFDMQTGDVMPLTFFQNGERGEQVHWSPDGKVKVYFNRSGVFIERDVASGAEREVNRVAGLVGVGGLSPDGRYFAPVRLDPTTKIASLLLVPAASGQPRELLRLTQPEVFVNCCVWTPDSRAVLFVKDTGSRRELWSSPVTGGRPRKLDIDPDLWMNGSADPEKEAFGLSPDGRRIAFQMGKTVSEVWALENFLPATKAKK